jgi:hypothetical protein
MERLYPKRGPVRINEFRSFALKPNKTMSGANARMMTLRRLLKQPEQMAVMLFLQAIQPNRLQEEICRQLMTLACDAEDWTLQQVGKIAARLENAHSFESLWMTAVRPERPAPASAAPAPSRSPPHNPMRLTTPLTCHECGKPGHKRPECPRLSRTKAPAAAHRGAAGPPSGPQDMRKCYTCGEISLCGVHRGKWPTQRPVAPTRTGRRSLQEENGVSTTKSLTMIRPSAKGRPVRLLTRHLLPHVPLDRSRNLHLIRPCRHGP